MDLYNGHTSLVFLYSNYAKGVRESEMAKDSPSLITMAVRSELLDVATTLHTSSCSKADLSFGRFSLWGLESIVWAIIGKQ